MSGDMRPCVCADDWLDHKNDYVLKHVIEDVHVDVVLSSIFGECRPRFERS